MSDVFDKIYDDYIKDVAALNFDNIASRQGLKVVGEKLVVPFYGLDFIVAKTGIEEPDGFSELDLQLVHSIRVAICKYLLLLPEDIVPEGVWASYRDFPDAAPFVGGFRSTVELRIAGEYGDRLKDLEKACGLLGGRQEENAFNRDLVYFLTALPSLPVLLLFNEKDDEFPAECNVLFKSSAERYLDMESLAILGIVLPWFLRNALRKSEG